MSAASSSRRPLAGVRIIDMSRLAPGPYCTMLLADLGAEVIVVGGGRAGNPVATFSRGKHFIKLDLKAEAGQKALRKLVEKADVFVESFRPGVARRLGAGYEDLKAANPGLIYCSVTGYGQTGPLAQEAGHDISYLALTGVLGAIGPGDGPPTGAWPQTAGVCPRRVSTTENTQPTAAQPAARGSTDRGKAVRARRRGSPSRCRTRRRGASPPA